MSPTSSASPPSPTTTTTTTPLCQVCTIPMPAKYTCPRCHTPTCSLPCTNSHKTQTGCSAIRNKAAYIPMNKYGWGSMMDDYCFLEDISRRVGEWGRDIVRGGFDMGVEGRGSGGMRRGRGGRGGRGMRETGRRGRGGKGKREMLKMQLEVREIEMELASSGMERNKLNHSLWDFKRQTALLTIQFMFHPSAEARSTTEAVKPFTLLTHNNNLSMSLLTLLQNHVRDWLKKKSTKKRNADGTSPPSPFPSWIPPLILPPPEDQDNFTVPHFVIPASANPLLLAHSSALSTPNRPQPKPYHSLDPNPPLLQSLHGTQFVEFPLIEVWEEFTGVLVDRKTGGVTCVSGSAEQQGKRRKLNPAEGRETMSGLVGQYKSDDEEEEEEEEEENGDTIGLVEYIGSEEETEAECGEREDQEDQDDECDLDPAALLKLMQQVRREGKGSEEDEGGSDMLSDEGGTTV